MTDETPVLDALAEITAASVKHKSLALQSSCSRRMAALIAVDALPASCPASAAAAASRVTAGGIQGVMSAVAPASPGADGVELEAGRR